MTGKRRRSFFNSKSAAEAEATRLRSEVDASGSAWNNLPAAERSRLMDAWRQATAKGVDLQSLLNGTVVTPAPKERTLAAALEELLQAKQSSGKSPGYLVSLRLVLNKFIRGRESLPIHRITLSDVESFLDAHRLAYRSTLRARLSALFKFATRRRYRLDNPCLALESITYLKPPVQIFTPMQTARCLVYLRQNPRAMGWFVLTTFYGLRPEEAEKTRADKINFETGLVIVEEQTSKVSQRRVVESPHAKAADLLRRAREAGAEFPINRQLRRRTVRRLREVLGWKTWPKDVTRHTAASMWLGLTHRAEYVAEQLGHSVTILKRNYKALVTPDQVRRFYGEL